MNHPTPRMNRKESRFPNMLHSTDCVRHCWHPRHRPVTTTFHCIEESKSHSEPSCSIGRISAQPSRMICEVKKCSQCQCKYHHNHRPTSTSSESTMSRKSLYLVIAVFSCLLCVTVADQSRRISEESVSRYNTLYSQMRRLQHRNPLHPHHHPHHHNRKSHHYYQSLPTISGTFGRATTPTSSQYSSPALSAEEESRSRPTTSPLAPFYLLQQIVRQQRAFGRHSHPYYHHVQPNQSKDSELNPITGHTLRKWNSARQKGARQLKQQQPNNSTVSNQAKIIYQLNWIKSDDQLPICEKWQVCNKVDTYSSPWIEKQCRCPLDSRPCQESLNGDDGHTVSDKTRHYKLCEPVRKLATCRYFRDITWTITTTTAKLEKDLNSLLDSVNGHRNYHHQHNSAENITRQEMKCICPANSVAYISKHQVYQSPDGQLGYRYHFACSPETKLRCKRKEPCGLFTARKRLKVEEVTTNTLCQCPGGFTCPTNHRHPSVLVGTVYPLDNVRTYSAYCYPTGPSSNDEIDSESDPLERETASTTERSTQENIM